MKWMVGLTAAKAILRTNVLVPGDPESYLQNAPVSLNVSKCVSKANKPVVALYVEYVYGANQYKFPVGHVMSASSNLSLYMVDGCWPLPTLRNKIFIPSS